MTAKEALKISKENSKDIMDIYKSIKSAATSGLRGVNIGYVPEEHCTILRENGFSVNHEEASDGYPIVKISW